MNGNYVARWTQFLALGIVIAGISCGSTTTAQQGTTDGQWLSYGGDKGSTKYAPLNQITRENFSSLKVVWQWQSIDAEVMALDGVQVKPQVYKSTPLMANGVLYTTTTFSQVVAIDAGTGEMLWKYDSGSWRDGTTATTWFVHRGVSYWVDGDDERIILAAGNKHLIALDAKTGKPIVDFGDGGHVDLAQGLNRSIPQPRHKNNSPPIICRDVIVVGSAISDRPPTMEYVRGDIRGYDVRTGEKLWQFHSVPQEGEFGVETWENDSWKYSGNTNVWTLMSADEDLGYVYLPFGAATNDYYGGHRPGDNLFANSLVCLDARTGERIWHFQTIHHDIWDYDLPAAPNLVDVVVDGKPIKAVAQMGKTGFCYVFDRVTGEPVWPIPEVPVPQSTVPGEKTSPTQPMPTKPPPFSAQGVTEETLMDLTPELRQEALEIVSEYGFSPLFNPPNEKGVFMTPGDGGGANWSGAALDPETSIIYVSSISYTRLMGLTKPDPNRSNMRYVVSPSVLKGPFGLSLLKPPYSRITAIDLKTGTHVWMKPMGDGPRDHPKLKHLNLPQMGGGGRAFPLAMKNLLIVGHDTKVMALNKATGELIGELDLQSVNGAALGRVSGAPMTYMHEGKQYIAVALSQEEGRQQLVAFSLP